MSERPVSGEGLEAIDNAIAALRESLPEEQLEAALEPLLQKRQTLVAHLQGPGAVAQQGGVAAGQGGVAVGGDVVGGHKAQQITIVQGDQILTGEQPVALPAVDRASALGRYLDHVISRNRYLQLQGIRSGGRLVHIELDRIYITLRSTRQRAVAAEEAWLAEEGGLAPGEARRRLEGGTETVTVSVNEALGAHRRLAVLGDPGSGKTTLLRYLALLYARDVAEEGRRVGEALGLSESGHLPVLLYLRRLGAYLSEHGEEATEGHKLLLDFLFTSLAGERIELPGDFFDPYLRGGRAVVLFDGLDEVADPRLRRRVSRLVESFTAAYPECRYVVSSRVVGYIGAARLGEKYATTTIHPFTLADVRSFLGTWHLQVAVSQMGPGESAAVYASRQTGQLVSAIEANERIRDLAINPLLLTVIALVHRDRVKLPDRRAELYGEAVDVLLGKWDEARGVREIEVIPGQSFDAGDKRLLLQALALWMHERQLKEIGTESLQQFLIAELGKSAGGEKEVRGAAERFLKVIEERAGLLVARGEGVYGFSHLTFQEYLAALAVAARDDYVAFTLRVMGSEWWREVVLLEAGHLSLQSKERCTRLIESIARHGEEPEPYHNLVLAAECLQDVGGNRVSGALEEEIRRRLRAGLEKGRGAWGRVLRRLGAGVVPERRIHAARALAQIGGHEFWMLPNGEPEWVEIPAGEFWMGAGEEGLEHERPQHRLHLDSFLIAQVPVTNAQYELFVKATGHGVPTDWDEGRIPKNRESYPVVNVSWHDAMAYCRWLAEVTGKAVTLPSEAQWEKAARGAKDKRVYPWGEEFEATRCNCGDLGLGDLTPVGIFPAGASPYGCLDMAGNVWEWTRSLLRDYPYDPGDGRENLKADNETLRVLRGGSFLNNQRLLRCAARGMRYPDRGVRNFGFGCCVSPISLNSEPSGA